MILAIDIGNTNIVIGCIEDDKILFVERLSTNTSQTVLEYAISFKNVLEIYNIRPDDIEGSILSSVVPPITSIVEEAAQKMTGKAPLVVGPGVKTGLNILMDAPGSVGSDLISAAVAGVAEYPLPLIIFDFGTASTVYVVDKNKNFIGGMIMPGIRTSADSLTSRTSQLPKVSLEAPKKVIGKNTIDCMKSGIIYGNAACMDGIIQRINEELGETATAVATGGLASTIVPHCKSEVILDNELLLKGLHMIYKKNI